VLNAMGAGVVRVGKGLGVRLHLAGREGGGPDDALLTMAKPEAKEPTG
jgi:hypothetical protein